MPKVTSKSVHGCHINEFQEDLNNLQVLHSVTNTSENELSEESNSDVDQGVIISQPQNYSKCFYTIY